jgi:hypothetical protein
MGTNDHPTGDFPHADTGAVRIQPAIEAKPPTIAP